MTVTITTTRTGPPLAAVVPLCIAAVPDWLCLCGGDLAQIVGALVHTDTCGDCRDRPGTCPDRADHRACTTPEPVGCDHANCYAISRIYIIDPDGTRTDRVERTPARHNVWAGPCTADHEHCCGCCSTD